MGGHAIAGPDGGGGGSGVSGVTQLTSADASVTLSPAGGTGTVDLKVNGTFGEDTTLQKANAAATLKKILELIAAYTNNGAGVEASTWTMKVLQAGAQVVAQVVAGLGTLFPAGNFDGTPANTVCGVGVGSVDYGMNKFVGGLQLAFCVAGRELFFMQQSGGVGSLEIDGTFAKLLFNGGAGTDCSVERTVDAGSNQSNLSVIGRFNSAQTDVVIGTNGALANSAAGGFLQLPSMPGIPSAQPFLNTGKRALSVINTANRLELALTDGTAWQFPSAVVMFSGSLFGAAGATFTWLDNGGGLAVANQTTQQKFVFAVAAGRRVIGVAFTVLSNTFTGNVTLTIYKGATASGFGAFTITPSTPNGASSFGVQWGALDTIDVRLDGPTVETGHRLDISVTIEYAL